MFRGFPRLLSLAALLAAALSAQTRSQEYALVLADPPGTPEARAAQGRLRAQLSRRGITTAGSLQTLANVIFVRVARNEVAALRGLPGVARVQYLPPMKRHLDRALDLVRAREAWNAVGGMTNAGAGVKIAILDTGIDQTHAAFQDSSLTPPAGFPKGDAGFTNSKVIVARSYVRALAVGRGTVEDSRPDDLSPRDRDGHGTAMAMIAAGAQNSGPAATITGVAPKAYLGNYKIFGTPGVNDVTFSSVFLQALEDAANDGMDVAIVALGSPAFYGPLEFDQRDCGGACDVRAQAVESAVNRGLTVIVSAGNDGDAGLAFPTLNSIHTPGTAPSAITVGASTNSHIFYASLRAESGPRINAVFGDGPKPVGGALTGPLRDSAQLGNNGRACSPLAGGSLTGSIALIQRGDCDFKVKINNAQKAGAIGAVVFQRDGLDALFVMPNTANTGIPAVLIGNTDGRALQAQLRSGPDRAVTMDLALAPVDATFNTVAGFSSHGPAIDTGAIKPELVAVGTDLYTAAQRFDPNGQLYDPSGYTSVQGTSFGAAMVGGAAAMVKQRNPGFTPGQIKSAVVNTATSDVNDDDGQARVEAVGAGKLNAADAVNVGATVQPATLSFGILVRVPVQQTLRLTNTSNAPASFTITVSPRDRDSNAQLNVTPSSLNLNAGQTGSITASLSGRLPSPGSYEGFVSIQGAGSTLRVPYLYLVGDNIPFDLYPTSGATFVGLPGDTDWLLSFRVLDRAGVPVVNAPVRFRVVSGVGRITQADASTAKDGFASAIVTLGNSIGDQIFTAEVGGLTVEFDGVTRPRPVIDRIVNADGSDLANGALPGAYVSLVGSALSDASLAASTDATPLLSLAGVSVSFDAPQAGLSLPGRLKAVSENRIDVQVPMELQGQSSVLVKVSIGDISSAIYNLRLAEPLARVRVPTLWGSLLSCWADC